MIIQWWSFPRLIVNIRYFNYYSRLICFSLQGPYCVKAKKVLGKYQLKNYKVIELDELDDGNEYQKVLGNLTNARTVPRVFIAGECIGGGDETEKLDRKGDLKKRLEEAGAIEN